MKDKPPSLLKQWDTKILFDNQPSLLKPSLGEEVYDVLDQVEDTKGNNGQNGRLIISNLRLVWYCAKSISVNLSIGLNCIQSVQIQLANSRLRGRSQALYLLAKVKDNRFEFIFTYIEPDSDDPRLFTTAQTLIKGYQSTRMYRELKLRGTFLRDAVVELMPRETLHDVITGVWNLAGDQGHLGAFHITNLRVVWQSMINDHHNLSLPFLQVVDIEQSESKYGKAIVLVTSESSGGFTLGFRIDPASRIADLVKLLRSIWFAFLDHPIFGMDPVLTTTTDSLTAVKDLDKATPVAPNPLEKVEIMDEDKLFWPEAPSSYRLVAPIEKSGETGIVFDPHLGLAMEKIQQTGIQSSAQLWALF